VKKIVATLSKNIIQKEEDSQCEHNIQFPLHGTTFPTEEVASKDILWIFPCVLYSGFNSVVYYSTVVTSVSEQPVLSLQGGKWKQYVPPKRW
jgi:hypothetical protein